MNPSHLVLPLGLLLAAACQRGLPEAHASAGDLRLEHGFAFEPITPASGAAYVAITNRGRAADTLLSITSPAAAMVMAHGGTMSGMGPVEVPAGGSVRFTPGGAHLMLSDFSAAPKAGDSLTIVLTFAHAGTVQLALPVRPYASE